jgi:hypothetical protein
MIQGSNTESLGEIVRHGKGDAYITLSVGGTEFHTLRSTISISAVLADHVARAEANAEITHKGAVFIDRDPAQFGIILQYLRNNVESLNSSSSHRVFATCKTQTYLQLPKDLDKLNDLYTEASYFRMPELQKALCEQNWLVNLTQLFGGGNPFTAASKTFARLRAILVALSGTFLVGSQGVELENILGLVGLQKKDGETKLHETKLEPG